MSLIRTVLCAWLLLWTGMASAHELSMAEMDLRETARGDFVWQWIASGARPAADELKPVWPSHCRAEANTLRCGEQGLTGTLSVDGVGKAYSAALVKVHWADGQKRVYTITTAQRSVRLWGSADDQRGVGEVAAAYGVLGVEHILSGFDHLLFVIALLFLVGFGRRLLWTITAFTGAHSLTLALSALGWLTLRRPPVEAAIALSIVLVAAEALHSRQTLSRRWPALVAFLFGLVHGLGFAGALEEIGLPQNHLLTALLTFNLGVEAGQVLVVAVAWAAYRVVADRAQLLPARAVALYAIGSIAAFWSIDRIVAIVS
jgi:hydrogenase/urease accessory protein HupE